MRMPQTGCRGYGGLCCLAPAAKLPIIPYFAPSETARAATAGREKCRPCLKRY